ncbi:MAG: PAS domain-containing protein [Solibacillus sp.]
MKLEGFVISMFSINYEALFELNTDAMIVVNQTGVVIQANQAFHALSQFEFEDFQNRSYETFFQYLHDQHEITKSDQRMQLICKDVVASLMV